MQKFKVLNDKFNKFVKIFQNSVDKSKKICYLNIELIAFCS